jgi:hypothetical protein
MVQLRPGQNALCALACLLALCLPVVADTTGVTMSSYTISPSTVTSGDTVTLTMTLTGPAPDGGASVLVGSGNQTAQPVQSPYLIPAGQTSASFTVTTGPVSASPDFRRPEQCQLRRAGRPRRFFE